MTLFGALPGLPDTIVDGPDEMRKVVRELIRNGADVIKVATSGGVLSPSDDPRHAHFRPAELEVLVEEATAAGRFVMAHAQGAEGIKNAIRAGIRSIEHGIYLDDEAIDLMLERKTWLVATLVAPLGVLEAADAGVAFPPAVIEKAKSVVEIHAASFRKAVEAGVRIAMGTDTGVTPHGRNLRELGLMAKHGMAPLAVLEATTRSAAQLLGVDEELGTIEPGKLADLVVIAGRCDGRRHAPRSRRRRLPGGGAGRMTGPDVSFEVAAERYDAFMGRWSRQLAPQLADLAGIDAPARVLDVGCGTGMLTAELVAPGRRGERGRGGPVGGLRRRHAGAVPGRRRAASRARSRSPSPTARSTRPWPSWSSIS